MKKLSTFIVWLIGTIVAAVVIGLFIPSNYTVQKPAPVLQIADHYKVLTVTSEDASWTEYLLAKTVRANDWTLLKKVDAKKSSVTNTNQMMASYYNSQYLSQKVASDLTGSQYTDVFKGFRVVGLRKNVGDLQVGDIITKIEGVSAENDLLQIATLSNLLPVDQKNVTLTIERGSTEKTITTKEPLANNVRYIDAREIKNDGLPNLSNDDFSGPSAGLIQAIYYTHVLSGERVSKDIAATGAIDKDGNVIPVSGIKQKIMSAIHNDIDMIIVPNKNLTEAISASVGAKNVEIVGVTTVEDAINVIKSKGIVK